ncbi:putative oxidoreductase C-terminal domain-containing protein [Fulvivirgaceae bacterium BMA10]|uniref:Oxidoreductase C-terminal domain-containing protein n=2 Tax=Splendidivirga corallicola TaxID=3051826 RepID=A0ABT8KVT5_9BACT|nr:putative oxidoreductase C-terminal domain-containing protein [Fulvivirgaceae bacterium BMA10]
MTDLDNNKFTGAKGEVKLMTLDPGHFHAGLVQKFMYDQIDPVVNVFAPDGPDVNEHLARIEAFNNRVDSPTGWKEKVYRGSDFFEKMISERPGNVVVISGNNAKKTEYIRDAIAAGINVLADKPMVITPEEFDMLKDAFRLANEKGVLLYDIMTERYEITTILQKTLSQMPDIFGQLETGSLENPAVTKESVHHFFKYVSGSALIRPAWFFDVTQQGEGIVDVTTHLVDLIQWECFPEEIIDYENEVEVLTASRWPTKLTPAQFNKVTGLDQYPDYLVRDVANDSMLHVYANGEINYKIKGIHAKASVIWNFQAPEGAKDTHYSIMRGTKANLIIRQEKEQNYKPTLYVEPVEGTDWETLEESLTTGIDKINQQYPGVALEKSQNGWIVVIPDKYKLGHEAHFTQVTERYLEYLKEGKLPDWEVPNMLAKYYITTQAFIRSKL